MAPILTTGAGGYPIIGGGGGAVLTYLGSVDDTGSIGSTTFSFTGLDFGTAANTMIIVGYAGNFAGTISADVNGVTGLTLDAQQTAVSVVQTSALLSHFYSTGPGTGQTINVTCTNSANNFRSIFVYKLVGATSSTVVQTSGYRTDSGVTTPASPTINVAGGDFMFAPLTYLTGGSGTTLQSVPPDHARIPPTITFMVMWDWSGLSANSTFSILGQNGGNAAAAFATYH